MDFLKKLFSPSNTWDQYKLVSEMRKWQDSNSLPLISALPETFVLSQEFWDKVDSIHRYTEQDGKEHAISAWSIYKQVFFTDVTRGDETQVKTEDKIEVKFDPVSGQKSFVRIVFVNGKERERTTIPHEKMPKKPKDTELRYLFNVHTHPPHRVANMIEKGVYYSYFSATDLNSLLGSKATITGLVTDKVSFLFKTRNTPHSLGLPEGKHPNAEYIKDTLQIVEYEADFKSRLFTKREPAEHI